MTGKLPPTACPDWGKRLASGRPPLDTRRLPTQTGRAERWSAIFSRLRVPDLPGTPEMGSLENFGWLDAVGRALYGGDVTEALLCVGKKNSKTTSGSLMALAGFLADRNPNQTTTIVAPTIPTAQMAFDTIRGAIAATPELDAIHAVRRHTREIENLRTGSSITVKAASLDALTGLKGSVFLDELHIWGNMKEGTKIRQQLRGALAVSDSARGLYITTMPDRPPSGVFKNMLDYGRAVRDGEIEDASFLYVGYEPWEGCDPWTDETVWPKLLPSFPHVADREFYRNVVKEANRSGAQAIAEAKSQFFNVEIRQGEQGTGWQEVAAKFQTLSADFDLMDLVEQSERLAVGIDLGGAWDMSAMAVLGIDADGMWRVWCRTWLTEKGYGAMPENVPFYDDFVAQGDLAVVKPGEDVNEIVETCEMLRDTGKLNGVGVDPAGAAELADALEAGGFKMGEDLHGVAQSAVKMAPAFRSTGRAADRDGILFAAQPVMGWALNNVNVVKRGNADGISKEFASNKIDPVMALLSAVVVEIHHRPRQLNVAAMVA